ncbi:MAG: aspartate ammonia-lyase [Candidatus Latescibacteria bacterium]|nr:aspartate ammonia-lyase [Candidatus Latescibacterota bacterium]NIO01039.1 aspartate ammonia-lyase [Candidatus Latescibacterota bacterium]NIO27438.1 aspartate ammonia-lyase [Candidatus Latescibacterota bacterium]NIO54960.1 aspartate ammonia-lyase [Candidatus Latescibacterota bacterium]NIT01049.1 aspartate ammonia-lyase [Candidatus Latescibacterota bacterium]
MIMKGYRIERDTLGEVRVPKGSYYGAQTQRAVENFPISNLRLQPEFIRAQAIVKLAAARANVDAGQLDPKIGNAIMQAAREVMDGHFSNQFVVDVFQAGAGTSQNMNMNEVLANRASEILGGRLGEYRLVHPNDHVNMGQSTNDTIHTAIHISALIELQDRLLPALEQLVSAVREKEKEFDNIVKCGRTHLQDAVPMRLGQEFGGYASMLEKNSRRLEDSSDGLAELAIGGTAVGTGLNAAPHYRKRVIAAINELTGRRFRSARNLFEAMQSMDAVVECSGALRVLVTSLKKIADDLRLLQSGPRTGLGEIHFPPVQPGSSMMPGKVNPVLAEMLDMVCFHAMGNDAAVLHAAQAGQLELNVMMPVIAYNLLQAIQVLSSGMNAFAAKCVRGIESDEDTCRYYAERSAALATALSPYIGYEKASDLAKESLEANIPIRELLITRNIMSKADVDKILHIRGMTVDPEKLRRRK